MAFVAENNVNLAYGNNMLLLQRSSEITDVQCSDLSFGIGVTVFLPR